MTRPRLLPALVATAAGSALLMLTPTPALAITTLRHASTVTGWDVSWPQCPSSLPHGGGFGVVGVTGGRPWGANPCLLSQYQWAAARPGSPSFYMNTANPAPHSSFYWPVSGSSDPALCKDATSTSDPGCAYDYGWHSAANALGSTISTLASVGIPASAATTRAWWLDVETGNSWNGTGNANAADLQGSIDYLRSQGVPAVGVYSTSYQWTTITGGYTTSNAASYAAAWKPEFTSAYGITGSPDWIAGASNARQAAANCHRSFTGVAVQLAQYPSAGFDADLRCG